MRRRSVPFVVLASGLLGLILGGCGSDPDAVAALTAGSLPPLGQGPPGAGGGLPPGIELEPLDGAEVEVIAVDNSFQPVGAAIAAGTEVTWVNRGQQDHNIITEDESAEWTVEEENFAAGDEAVFTFTEPGTYRYYCSIHGTIDVGMPGVIVVE